MKQKREIEQPIKRMKTATNCNCRYALRIEWDLTNRFELLITRLWYLFGNPNPLRKNPASTKRALTQN